MDLEQNKVNHLQLSISRTNEMVDFKWSKPPVTVDSVEVEESDPDQYLSMNLIYK